MAMNYNTKRISVDFLLIPRVGWVKSIQSGDLHEVFLSCMVIVFVYRIQLEMYLKKKIMFYLFILSSEYACIKSINAHRPS